jgi:hypothetical protein
MNPLTLMDKLSQAFGNAIPTWEQAIMALSWYHGIILVVYLGAAWLCLLNAQIAKDEEATTFIWYLAAIALCLLGVNAVLRGDVFVTLFLRSLALLQGWYEERRLLQDLTIGALVFAFLFAASRWRVNFAATDLPSGSMAFGLAVLIALLALRTVSAHGTDAVLNLRLAGVSVGRLLEFAGLGLVLHGALRCLRLH